METPIKSDRLLGNTNANDAREFVARLPELLRQNGCDAIISAAGA